MIDCIHTKSLRAAAHVSVGVACLMTAMCLSVEGQAATASRSIQDQAGIVTVQIDVQPDAGTEAYCLEDQLPSNVAGRSISDGGSFDSHNGKVKWGPFLDAQPRTVSYQLVASESTTGDLVGGVSFDGTTLVSVAGDAAASVVAGGIDSWLLRELGAGVFSRPESQPGNNEDGDLFSIAVEYYFGLNPRLPDPNPVRMERGGGAGGATLSFVRLEGTVGVTLRLRQTTDFSDWLNLEGDPDQPIIQSLGNGYEQVDYQLPAVQGGRIVNAFVELTPP
jgi:hypothetical protein